MIMQIIVFAIVLVLMENRKRKELCIPYTLLWISLGPIPLSLSLQFSSVYYIFSFAVIGLLCGYEFIDNRLGFQAYFAIIGIITNWLDLLTYPLITLGVPLTVFIILNAEKDNKKRLVNCMILSISWCVGYFGMWILKWVLSSVALGQNLISDALKQAAFRVSGSNGTAKWTRYEVVQRNLVHFAHKSFYILCAGYSLYSIFRIKSRGDLKTVLFNCSPYLFITVFPFIWYLVLSNHSWLHHWFTFRSLGVSIFALACLPHDGRRMGRRGDKTGK